MNLIVRDGVASIFNQTAQFIRIRDVVEKAFGLPLLCQRFQLADNLIQFPGEPCLSDPGRRLGVCAYCSSFVLLSCSLTSPSEVDAQSVAERALTLGANDSIACMFAFVRWNAFEGYKRY